ncbi:MAG: SMP-30/gluconolactonase/LRE family protein [Phycisphaerales bacterium]|nr:SMP-30/gluconolactonase/LRE family protein [Phycisphaerales bacterium]
MLAALGVALGYLLLWPIDVDPLAWQPPTGPPLAGAQSSEFDLSAVELLGQDASDGPEDVAIDELGRLYAGMLDGRIVRFDRDGQNAEILGDTGGRPLGLDFDPEGHLIVADAYKGLLCIDPSGAITVLAVEHDGVPFMFTDDVDVAPSGMIYFTDASSRRGLNDYDIDFIEQRGSGRLMRYDPATKQTELLLGELNFANGVAVSPDESFVLVNETARYCIHRVWLTGARAGESEIFIDNLPGFPDGVSCNGTDRFWVAIVSPRSPVLDFVHPRPWLKRAMCRLPRSMLPKPQHSGLVLGLDLDGAPVEMLRDPSGEHFSLITSVEEHDGMLYLGSLSRPNFARAPRPEPK